MVVERWAQVEPAEWDALVEQSDDTWLYHLHEWIERSGRVRGWPTCYLVARENGRPVGGFPLQLITSSRFARPFSFVASIFNGADGPFAARGLADRARARVLAELTEVAVEWAREQGAEHIACSLPALAPANLANVRGVNPLVSFGWEDRSSHTRIVDLSVDEASLMAGLVYDARRNVRLARDAGYTVARERWGDMVDEYYRVHQETYQRTGAAAHPKDYFRAIAAMAERGVIVLWVARDRGGRPVAFHSDGQYRQAAVYWSGCCESAHLRSGVNYLLFWEAMIGAKAAGCRWYESGEAFPGVQEGKLRGLTLFKEKFGGELYRSFAGEIRLKEPFTPHLSWQMKAVAYRWLERAKGAATSVTQRVQ